MTPYRKRYHFMRGTVSSRSLFVCHRHIFLISFRIVSMPANPIAFALTVSHWNEPFCGENGKSNKLFSKKLTHSCRWCGTTFATHSAPAPISQLIFLAPHLCPVNPIAFAVSACEDSWCVSDTRKSKCALCKERSNNNNTIRGWLFHFACQIECDGGAVWSCLACVLWRRPDLCAQVHVYELSSQTMNNQHVRDSSRQWPYHSQSTVFSLL